MLKQLSLAALTLLGACANPVEGLGLSADSTLAAVDARAIDVFTEACKAGDEATCREVVRIKQAVDSVNMSVLLCKRNRNVVTEKPDFARVPVYLAVTYVGDSDERRMQQSENARKFVEAHGRFMDKCTHGGDLMSEVSKRDAVLERMNAVLLPNPDGSVGWYCSAGVVNAGTQVRSLGRVSSSGSFLAALGL